MNDIRGIKAFACPQLARGGSARRRGFTTLFVISLLPFIAMTVLAITINFRSDTKRTHDEINRAQLRAYLQSALPVIVEMLRTTDGDLGAQTRAIHLPDANASLTWRVVLDASGAQGAGKRPPAAVTRSNTVEVTATSAGLTLVNRMVLTKDADGVALTAVDLHSIESRGKR